MSTVLTLEAYHGYIAAKGMSCPYLHSSPSSMAWHLGHYLAEAGEHAPTPDASLKDQKRVAVTMGRGMTLNLRGYKDTLLGRYQWNENNTFRRLNS